MIKLIIGLANIEKKYANTRHNIGALFINLLAKRFNSYFIKEDKFFGYISHIRILNNDIRLLIPNTGMNLSGKSVAAISSFYNIKSNEILVVHDDLDVLPGTAKFKVGGGHGGHNGLKNIIDNLNYNSDFYRLRIGIGHPGKKNKVINFVLSEMSRIEQKLINQIINEAICCVETWFQYGFLNAVNRLHSFKFNSKNF